MQRKIILRPGRKLTDDEIKTLEKKIIVFSTVVTEIPGEYSSGHYDRFAGVRISSHKIRDPEITGVCDNLSCLMSNVIENTEYEYEISINESDSVPLYRKKFDKNIFSFRTAEEQLDEIKNTDLFDTLEDIDIVKKIKEKQEEAYKNRSSWDSTYEFKKVKQEKNFLESIIDEISKIGLREKAQVEEINDDGSKKILGIVRNNKKDGYKLLEFPIKLEFKLNGNQITFWEFKPSDCSSLDETKEEFINRISKINSLINSIPSYKQDKSRFSFVYPLKILSADECEKIILEIEQTHLENVNIREIPIEEIYDQLDESQGNWTVDGIINNTEVDDILKIFKDINDNESKKKMLGSFSKKDTKYTEEQVKEIQQILIELLEDGKGWKNNADMIAGFGKGFQDYLDFSERVKILQMSISAHNNFCKTLKFINLSDEVYWADRIYEERQNEKMAMPLSKLINQFFSKEEQGKLTEQLINQKNYQAMIMILKECKNYSYQSDINEYKEMSIDQKDQMAKTILKDKDKVKKEWPEYKVPYISDYIDRIESEKKISAVKQTSGKDAFYLVDSSMEYEIDRDKFKNQIKCFSDYKKSIAGYIDVEKAMKKIKDGKLQIEVPKDFVGRMIGKGGENIKKIAAKLAELTGLKNVRILISEKEKIENVVTFSQIKEAIKAISTKDIE